MSPEQGAADRGRTFLGYLSEYGVAVVVSALSLVAHVQFAGQASLTFSLMVLAVLLAGSYGGPGPGIVSAVLAAGGLVVLEPPTTPHDIVRIAVFTAVVAIAALAAGALRAEYRRAVVRRDVVEHKARKLAETQEFTAHLATAHELVDVDRAVLEVGLPALGAVGAIVARVGAEGLEITDVLGYPPDVMLCGAKIPLGGASPLAEAVRSREALWIESADELQQRFPAFASVAFLVGRGALAAIPISIGGACSGAIALSFPAARSFGAEDRGSILSLVTTAGQVFDRARLLEGIARERARAELLASMAADLNRGTDPDDVMRTALAGAARLLGGDDGALYLFEGDAKHLRGIAEVRPEQRVGTIVPVDQLPSTRRALDAGRARFFTRTTVGAGDADWFDRYELTGSIVAPLLQGDRRIGVLYVNYLGLAAPHPDEILFADAIAAQCALAISRAQAFETERLATARAEELRTQAEVAAERVGKLQAVTAALSSAVTMHDVAQVLIERGLDEFNAHGIGVVAFTGPGTLELVHGKNVSEEEFRALDAASHRGERLPIAEAIRSGRPVWIENAEEIRERYPVLEPLRAARGEAAFAVVPLVVASTRVGCVGLTFQQPRTFAAAERQFLEAVAQLAAQAFERARLFEAERAERARAAAAQEQATQTALVQEQLMAVVGHDLRTPLSAIAMGAQLMTRRGGLEPDQARTLARIQHSAERATYIIRDLLDYSSSRRGVTLSIHRQWTSVAEICERTVLELREVHRGVEITMNGSGDTALEADASRVAQAVSNLIGNAVQHGGGAVHVAVRGEADEVTVAVHNAGPPIPPEMLPVIFEPFQRNEADKAGARRGSVGLGLFIVREVVRAHGGKVDVRSDAHDGTTFTVHLPRERREQKPHERAGEPPVLAQTQ